MCGIVGIISKQDVVDRIYKALSRLEYRGYDSAGIAVVAGGIERRRTEGKLAELKAELAKNPLKGNVGIGHTRWATHGLPITKNAHPHSTAKVSVVHNGIIENFLELRAELTKKGYKFTSQTDTETIPVLITYYLDKGDAPFEAFKKAIARLEGAYAIAAIFAQDPNILMVARKGSPLAIGYGAGQMFVASDAIALAPLSTKICYLEDGDFALITRDQLKVFDEAGKQVKRAVVKSGASSKAASKGNFKHFMLKEIYEQPTAIAETLNAYYDPVGHKINLPKTKFDLRKVSKIQIIACGTSYYAGMVGKYWLEQIAKVQCEVDVASEFRYRKPVYAKGGLTLLISQSGETADTLAALRHAREHGQKIGAIVNVLTSSIAREADFAMPTLAGPEIGVASTKAFTAQLTCLASLAVALGENKKHLQSLADSASIIAELLHENQHEAVAKVLAKAKTILYIGRGTSYPIALEGALKLKELSYIHAEGFGAGELKHGPIALIDKSVPIVVVAPFDEYFAKTASNVREVAARGGKVILISNKAGCKDLADVVHKSIVMPDVPDFITPLVYSVPVQLLAYQTAVLLKRDVDQPRNLAKSVTVE
jgi:glucosamine--fructose-6-phosphate aminotransferase (isomerizing)